VSLSDDLRATRAFVPVRVKGMASPFVLGGAFTNDPSGSVAALVGLTGLMGGAGRYGAILVNRNESDIERATAIGFFGGLAVGCAVFLLEFVL